MITERDFLILAALVRYYVLNRQQIQRLVFPGDASGRITRRRLQYLVDQKLINRQNTLFCHSTVVPAPVYFPSAKGCELLSEQLEDERYLVTPTQAPIPHHTLHWLAVSDTHIALDAAIVVSPEVTLDSWINEWDVVNKSEAQPEKRFRLYTLIRDNPRLVCAPDAGFLLSTKGHRKVFYLEQDRGTSGVRQVASSKTQGYAVMAELRLHLRHFPESTLNQFSILMVAPTPKRRDALRRAIREKPGASLWRFAAAADVTAERILFETIWYPCDKDEPSPMVKRTPPIDASSASSAGGEP